MESSSKHKNTLDLSILLPTFNEANNIGTLVHALSRALKTLDIRYELLFIDDSTDRTPTVIRSFARVYPEIRLLHRPEAERTGLATAFVTGFKKARGRYLLCMDSDLQHPPELVPQLYQAIVGSNKDIIIGSRYRRGGGLDGLNTVYRKAVSRFCRLVSWVVLSSTRKTSDPGSGFFIVKKSLTQNLSFEGLLGFKILIDILARVPAAEIGEVAYVFRKRENEQSKATLAQGLAFLNTFFVSAKKVN